LLTQTARIDDASYRWFVLLLAGLTATLVVAMPTMAMPVLFAEMSVDLGLSLVQVGAVWGLSSLGGLVTGLAGGAIGDRFGTRRTLACACVALGAAVASVGLSTSFATLVLAVLFVGLFLSTIPVNLHRACGLWFSGKRLGLANSVVAAGMALGFMTGSIISATVLSPLLGDWRRVLFFYGAIGVAMSIPWAISRSGPRDSGAGSHPGTSMGMRQALSHVTRLKNVWLLGLALLCVGGCIQGMLGYLPLYLRDIGWPPARADAALASFHAISLLSVIPLALLSDRLGSRRRLLLMATVMTATGTGLLSVVEGTLVWMAVLMAGAVRDGFMAIFMTTVIEQRGVGALYAGTAIGLTMTLSRAGNLIAPPVGNSLARYDLSLPFAFWAAMALVGLVVLYLITEQ
jgi:MFS family permease